MIVGCTMGTRTLGVHWTNHPPSFVGSKCARVQTPMTFPYFFGDKLINPIFVGVYRANHQSWNPTINPGIQPSILESDSSKHPRIWVWNFGPKFPKFQTKKSHRFFFFLKGWGFHHPSFVDGFPPKLFGEFLIHHFCWLKKSDGFFSTWFL